MYIYTPSFPQIETMIAKKVDLHDYWLQFKHGRGNITGQPIETELPAWLQFEGGSYN